MSENRREITRFKAFTIHIGISIAIFLCLLVLLLGYWYKPPFFTLSDGPKAIQIIIFVDLVLGPLLTLIVFKPGKPGLKFDLSLIAVFQISALAYGVWMVQLARPATVFLSYDALYIASYETIKESNIPESEIDKIIGLEPTFFYIDLPKDQPDFIATAMKAFQEGNAIEMLYQYATPLSFRNKQQTSTIAIDIKKYAALKEEWMVILQNFLTEQNRTLENTTFLPIKTRLGTYLLAVDDTNGEIIDYLDIPYVDTIGKKTRLAYQEKPAARESPSLTADSRVKSGTPH